MTDQPTDVGAYTPSREAFDLLVAELRAAEARAERAESLLRRWLNRWGNVDVNDLERDTHAALTPSTKQEDGYFCPDCGKTHRWHTEGSEGE